MDLNEVVDWKWGLLRNLRQPEPGERYSYEDWKNGYTGTNSTDVPSRLRPSFEGHEYYKINLQDEFREKGLQVIVKLASIELTPEEPRSCGGRWHSEGMLNEHVVATAVFYYDCENVVNAGLAFRQEAQIDYRSGHTEDDHDALCQIFDVQQLHDRPAVQILGSVSARQGRLVAFPNILQHAVEGFTLEDPSQPGHCRFIVLHLVDPYCRIISTANVPPQRHDWWSQSVYEELKLHEKVPREIEKMVKDNVDEWPMGMDEAKKLKLELMRERERFVLSVERQIEWYNFYEH